jgi:hypothetical protein
LKGGDSFRLFVIITLQNSVGIDPLHRKGDPMRKKIVFAMAMLGIPLLVVSAVGNGWADLKVGDEAPSFTLPSSQDRLVDYYQEYYGKHHLIITFFPAAFTPV